VNRKTEHKCERVMTECKSGGIVSIYLCESGRLNLNVNKVVENKCEMVMDEE
jgi:hypothetical protein